MVPYGSCGNGIMFFTWHKKMYGELKSESIVISNMEPYGNIHVFKVADCDRINVYICIYITIR